MGFDRVLTWLSIAPIALAAQAPDAANGLAGARASFSAADRDGDGQLTLQELRDRRIAVTEREFRDEDVDANGAWSRDEFTVHHRTSIARSGARPAADLESESLRVLALRRARTVDETRARLGPAAGRLGGIVDPAAGATPELIELDARIERALHDLEDRAAGRGAVHEDYERVRGPWNERVTRVRALGEPAGTGDVPVRFARALDALESRSRAGSVAREHFAELRAAWDARPRRILEKAADATAVEVRFERRLSELEAKVFARVADRADWTGVRDLVPELARRVARGASGEAPAAEDPRVARVASDLRAALDRVEQRAVAGSVARGDFQDVRAIVRIEPRERPAPSDRDGAR